MTKTPSKKLLNWLKYPPVFEGTDSPSPSRLSDPPKKRELYQDVFSSDLRELDIDVTQSSNHYRPDLVHLLRNSATIKTNPTPVEVLLLNEAAVDFVRSQNIKKRPPPAPVKAGAAEDPEEIDLYGDVDDEPSDLDYWWM